MSKSFQDCVDKDVENFTFLFARTTLGVEGASAAPLPLSALSIPHEMCCGAADLLAGLCSSAKKASRVWEPNNSQQVSILTHNPSERAAQDFSRDRLEQIPVDVVTCLQ